MRPPYDYHESAMCPLFVRRCLWTLSTLGHHQVKFFLTIAQPTAFRLRARWSVFLDIHFGPFASVPCAWEAVRGPCWCNVGSAMCPPCVHHLPALCLVWTCVQTWCITCCPPGVCLGPSLVRLVECVRYVSALYPLWLPLQISAAMRQSGLVPHLTLYRPCVGFGRASKRCVSHVALCVRHVSAPGLFFVLSLSCRCSLFIRSLSVFCGSMVWLWPGLCQLCVPSLVLRLCLSTCVQCCPP